MSDPLDYAWAAGFVDGEGCFCVSRERDKRKGPDYANWRASFQVTNTDRPSLDHLRRVLFGAGRVVATTQRAPNHRVQHHWTVRNKPDIIRICLALLPYVQTKRAVLEQMLALCISRKTHKGMGKYAPWTANELRIVGNIRAINHRPSL